MSRRGERSWNAALPPGIYVVALRAREDRGAGVVAATEMLRVDGVER